MAELPATIPHDVEFCPRCRQPEQYQQVSDGPKQTTFARVCRECGKRWGGMSIRKDDQPTDWQQLALFGDGAQAERGVA